jgi:signal transduction histidine kinase
VRPLSALVAGVVLLTLLTGVNIALGTPPDLAVRTAVIAGAAGVVVGTLGSVLLKLLMHAALTAQVSAAVIIVVSVVAVGAVAYVNVVLTGLQLQAITMLLAAAAVVGVLVALMLAEDIRVASRSIQEDARGIADGRGAAGPRPAIPELAELAAELERTSAKLEDARAREHAKDQQRRNLVAWASHDLRSPLQRIRAAAEALEDGLVDDVESVTSLHRTIRAEAERVAALIDDLFELTRIQAGTLQLAFEPVAVDELVSELLAATAPAAAAKEIRLESSVAAPVPELRASPAHLARVLSNLLDNAVRETPAGGSVTVDVGVEGGFVVVAITDQCGGVAAERLQAVLTGAERGGDGSGAGLGLPIASGLVAAHGGELTAENSEDGCRFAVRLPLSATDRA